MPSKAEWKLIAEEAERETERVKATLDKSREEREELLWSLGLVEVSRLRGTCTHASRSTADFDGGGPFVPWHMPIYTFEFTGDDSFFLRLANEVTKR